MTRTEYGAKVTAVIDEQTGGGFEYPASFDADVDACFSQRLTPEAAAAKVLADYETAQADE